MTSDASGKVLREGSAQKRAAILSAARELFLADGFDRSSVDAVAARAKVSKRTVYDYFGDKRTLLLAVVEDGGQSLLAMIRGAIDDTLRDATNLEDALIRFAERVASSALGSSEYAALRRLMATESTHLPELADHWLSDAPEDALAERFAEFDRDGLLDVPDPRLAADHFMALTFMLAHNTVGHLPGSDVGKHYLVEGVRVFLRAYAPHARKNGRSKP